ncbi:MAG: F0F1 ATP synthase subunit B [Solobacterium sp.]|nr:F0F1 ATP synthase subunit B [Solobacterium sp.]
MIDIDIVGQLLPNPLTMIVQLCSTLVLFLLMKHFLWAAVQDFLAKRAEKMQADLAESEQAKQDALSDRRKAMEQLNEASDRAEEIVSAAVRQAKDEKESILTQASREADAERKKAREQIQAERQEMYSSMRQEMIEVAMAAAGKLISDQSNADLDRQAVDAFVKEAAGNEQ